jgi:putative FmdB family regulatory protein
MKLECLRGSCGSKAPRKRSQGPRRFIIEGFALSKTRTDPSHAMPIYAYRCEECGHAHDALQKMSDAPLVDCPACGKPALKKQLTAAGFQLKGGGWYATDFRSGNKAADSNATSSATGTSLADSPAAAPAAAPAPAAASTPAPTPAAPAASAS